MGGIYKITNKINNKVYVGQAVNFKDRERTHFYRLVRNEHHNEFLQKSYNKYGKENFIFEIIEEIGDVQLLNEVEKKWIDFYGGINSDDVYNLKDPLINDFSDYIKVNMSKNTSGENNPNYGNKWSDEQKKSLSEKKMGLTLEMLIGKEKADITKEKMSKSQSGRKHTEESKEKIRLANVGDKNPAYGMGHRQLGDKNPMYGKASYKRKSVKQLDIDGNLIKVWEFLSQVKEIGYSPSNVMGCANGNAKTSYGYIWVWI